MFRPVFVFFEGRGLPGGSPKSQLLGGLGRDEACSGAVYKVYFVRDRLGGIMNTAIA